MNDYLPPGFLNLISSQSGNMSIWKGNGAGPARESQSHCFADQHSKLTNTLLVQSHNMTTVKEIIEQSVDLNM